MVFNRLRLALSWWAGMVGGVSANGTLWHWVGFTAFVLVALAADLGVFHRDSRKVRVSEAAVWTLIWVASAGLFGFWIAPMLVPNWGHAESVTFGTGYIVELCLSMDNVFVIALIFRYFAVPLQWQHRILFWGILGALLMRGLLIAVGAAAVARWHWVLYGLGVLLVFTGFKMLFGGDEAASIEPERNPVVRMVRRFFPVTESFVGESFATFSGGRWMLTPLAIVLIVVETTDVAFAIDSIPAIFGITRDAFLVFTSNIFAILGLRSLYFVLAAIMDYFRLLKHALALALVVIGVKMVFEIPLTRWLGPSLDSVSLMLVLGIIGLSIVGSLVLSLLDRLTGKSPPP